VPSRAASPALSVKSRRSTISTSARHRNSFINGDLTDDEGSDSDPFEDFRSARGGRRDSRTSHNRRPRKNSTQSNIDYDDDGVESDTVKHRQSSRTHRGGSVARSVQDFPATSSSRRPLSTTLVRDKDREREMARQKLEKLSMSSRDRFEKNRIGSPATKSALSPASMTPESEFEFEKPMDYEEKPVNSDAEPKKTPTIEPERAKIEETEIRGPAAPSTSAVEPTPSRVPDDLGPPPTTPPHEWVCEFCTFVNEANVKICSICCKTPTHVPQKPATVPEAAAPPKPILTDSTAKAVTTGTSVSTPSEDSSEPAKKKGRIRKISFWPGTKTT
jgi:E3 ubiquitin-protein ligase RNF31